MALVSILYVLQSDALFRLGQSLLRLASRLDAWRAKILAAAGKEAVPAPVPVPRTTTPEMHADARTLYSAASGMQISSSFLQAKRGDLAAKFRRRRAAENGDLFNIPKSARSEMAMMLQMSM